LNQQNVLKEVANDNNKHKANLIAFHRPSRDLYLSIACRRNRRRTEEASIVSERNGK
jgi:hypothetical protein